MKDSLLEVRDETFEREVLGAARPVLVEFGAPWCSACRALEPVLAELSAEYPSILFRKLNVDTSPETAARYSVRSLPTVLLFREGRLVESFIGARPRGQVRALLEKLAA